MPPVPLPPAEPMTLEPLAEIARGGMGSVELARIKDGRFAGQVVALKRLHQNIAQDPEFVSMFLDEAWMTAALKHPNVMQVVAWGKDERGMFLACELVQGVALSRLLKEAKQNKEPFAERTCANIGSQICAALTAAHGLTGSDGQRLGLVHRDLTPGNVLVSFEGTVKIIDFGIAKAEERITHTRTGMLKGKPAYMAPEQAKGGKIDARADIFSFGVLMFELLAGRKPWMSKGAFDVMMEIAIQPPPNLGELRKGLNPEFVQIIHKCLEKKPDNRFSNAAEIQARFDAWRNQKGFMVDDQESLSNFVIRNSAPQILWFKQALSGDISKAAAPTFKELEELIDAEREGKDKSKRRTGSGFRPAAGAGAPPGPAAGAPPGPAAGALPSSGPPSGGPASGPPRSGASTWSQVRGPASGPVSSGPASPAQPPLQQEGAIPLVAVKPSPQPPPAGITNSSPPSSGPVSPSSAPPASSAPKPVDPMSKLVTDGGTEYLTDSSFAQALAAMRPQLNEPLPPPRPPSMPPPQLGAVKVSATPTLPSGGAPQALTTSPPAAMDANPLNASPAPQAQLQPAEPQRGGSRVSWVVLLLLVLFVGGGAFVYVARDRLHQIFDKGAPPPPSGTVK